MKWPLKVSLTIALFTVKINRQRNEGRSIEKANSEMGLGHYLHNLDKHRIMNGGKMKCSSLLSIKNKIQISTKIYILYT